METAKTEKNKPGVWEKGGPSPNPHGRPKGAVSVVDAIKRKLEEELPDSTNEEKRYYLDKIIEVYFEKAIVDKDTATLKDMIDRVDGKPLQKSDVTSAGKPIVMPTELYAKYHSDGSTEEDSQE